MEPGGDVESPLTNWLAAQCHWVAGCEAGLLVLGASPNAPGAACARWPDGAEISPRLSATVQVALERGRFSVQEAAAGDSQASTDLAVPVVAAGRTIGAVGLSVRELSSSESKRIGEGLELGLPLLLQLLAFRAERDRVASMATVSTRLLDHERMRPGAHAFAVELAQRLGCERVAVGWLQGRRLRVASLSNAVRFSEESDAIRELREAMQESIDQDARIEVSDGVSAAGVEATAHEDLLQNSGARSVCTIPLAAHGRAVGAVTLEWKLPGALDAGAHVQLEELATLSGPILELLSRAEAGPLARIRSIWTRWIDRHFGSQRLAWVTIGAALLLVAILAVVPGRYRISAEARLQGRVQRALVAAVPGYLSEANARAGDLVQAGDVLARLDDRDLRLEKRKWASRKAQLELEQREALAAQNRTQVSILRAQIDQADAELGLAEESLARTNVVAPFDGIVVEGDLDRSLGSPVEQGDVLFELAPLDGYRIIVEVDGRDIADVKPAQRGRLTLEALPDQPMSLVVERVTPISTAEDGRNYFRVEAALEEPVATLRPGMEGIAKIDAGQRRLLWIWTHELIDWLRLSTWTWLP
jgi:RND family efflux transporter MFP subunit